MGKPRFTQSEDCLTVNVWTPLSPGEKLPVLVWIHGGGYSSGSGAWSWYAGDRLSRNGRIVVVTINYRLGALGYLYIPELAGVDRGAGNRGLLDQIAAVRWVKDNIGELGGNTANITVAGQSGGGAAVACMMSIPETKSLFQRGILQSAALLPPFPVGEAERIGKRYREIAGIKTLDELRSLPVERILDAQARLAPLEMKFADLTPPFQPILDGEVLQEPFVEALMAGAGKGIDVIVGTNRREMDIQAPRLRDLPRIIRYAHRKGIKLKRPPSNLFGSKDTTREQVAGRFAKLVGRPRAEELVAAYASRMPGAHMGAVLKAMLVDEYDYRARRVAADQAAKGSRAWFYSFDWAPKGSPFGSCHTLELPFVFNNPDNWEGPLMLGNATREEIERVAWPMHQAWTSFVATGTPRPGTGVEWPEYSADARAVMHFGEQRPTVAEEPFDERLSLWESKVNEAFQEQLRVSGAPPAEGNKLTF
jgi:para-nitrobenzyl esterase